jgi:Raf kinase inhibitor-like YbhB/YbcL family protein
MFEKLPESVGHVLVDQRAGMEQVVYNHLHAQRDVPRLSVSSPTFAFNGRLPVRYTADGEGISPPIAWSDCPSDTASVAIIVEDADSPTPHPLVHAIAIDVTSEDRAIPEGALSAPNATPSDLEIGANSFFRHSWLPPDPPPGHGEHRYVFQVFALRQGPPFSKTAGRKEFIDRILDRAIAVGCLIGTYERGSIQKSGDEALVEQQPESIAIPA